jgi:hypothetical protein
MQPERPFLATDSLIGRSHFSEPHWVEGSSDPFAGVSLAR